MIKALLDWMFGQEGQDHDFEKRISLASEFPQYLPFGFHDEIIYRDILMRSSC